ncbi:MAG: AraC family transcriptional regulator [Blautia sp.]
MAQQLHHGRTHGCRQTPPCHYRLLPQQICDQIGIANVSYFYRQFKKSSGATPQQYRERHFHG